MRSLSISAIASMWRTAPATGSMSTRRTGSNGLPLGIRSSYISEAAGYFGGLPMKRILIASVLTISLPALAFAQSAADLKNAANTPDRVLTYGMSYSQQRFSTLTQINRQTVRRLVPAWAYS